MLVRRCTSLLPSSCIYGKQPLVLQLYSKRFSGTIADKKESGYWSDVNNQKSFLQKLGDTLGFRSYEDWYNITLQDILKHEGGASFMQKFGNSPNVALSSVYKDHKWYVWKFKHVASDFWVEPKNAARYMTWLGGELGVKNLSDWYNFSTHDVSSNHGQPLVKKHQTLGKICEFAFPEHKWQLDKFDTELPEQANQNHDLKAEREYMTKLGKKLGYKTMDDWYKIAVDEFYQNEGAPLLRSYGKSAARVVMKVFHDHEWLPWKFEHTPKHWAEDILTLKKYIKHIEPALKVQNFEDWYRVSRAQVNAQGPLRITEPEGLYKLMKLIYPAHIWDVTKFDTKVGKKSPSQIWLSQKLVQIFPKHNVVEDYAFREAPSVVFDNYIPDLKLVLDYIPRSMYAVVDGVPQYNEKAEEERKKVVETAGVKWIKIPYWWQGDEFALACTIKQNSPKTDVAEKWLLGAPIAEKPRKGVVDAKSTFFMLGHDWDMEDDPTGWWMSEKYDGTRSYWDGKDFWSRTGKVMPMIPDFFKKGLPDVGFDGELWIGRSRYNDMATLVKPLRGKLNSDGPPQLTPERKKEWNNVKFIVFDMPELAEPFESRLKAMKELKVKLPPQVKIAEYEECKGHDHLIEYIDRVTSNGGEGIMLRKPGSMYVHGRVNTMMKVKPYAETELILKGVQKGVLIAETPDGVSNSIRCPPQVILNPPPIGSVISVKYMHRYKNNTLRAARFHRVRHELTWDDVVKQYKQELLKKGK